MKLNFLGRQVNFSIKRASHESDSSNPAEWLLSAFGTNPTEAGVPVNELSSLKISAVYACVRVISEAIASLPKGVYGVDDKGNKTSLRKHNIYNLIHYSPGPNYSAFNFFNTEVATALLWGNAYGKIIRDNYYRVTEIEIRHPKNITVWYEKNNDNKKILVYEDTERHEMIDPIDMIHIPGLGFDGVIGMGVISFFARESMGLSMAAERFGSRFFGRNASFTGYLQAPGKLSEPAQKNLKDSWKAWYSGVNNSFSTPVLEEGMEFKSVGIPPEQAQFILTRQHQVEEICRWFNVQPHLIQHLLRSTNNNIEHQGIEFVTHTLRPWVIRFEQELNRKLFAPSERYKVVIEMNMEGLLRGDLKTRTDSYRAAIQWGYMTPNEVRKLENMNPYPGGNYFLVPTNMTTSDQLSNPGNQQTNSLERVDEKTGKKINGTKILNENEN